MKPLAVIVADEPLHDSEGLEWDERRNLNGFEFHGSLCGGTRLIAISLNAFVSNFREVDQKKSLKTFPPAKRPKVSKKNQLRLAIKFVFEARVSSVSIPTMLAFILLPVGDKFKATSIERSG